MKDFFQNLKSSFQNPEFYSLVKDKSISNGIKFLLILTIFSTFLLGTKILIHSIPDIQKIRSNDYVEKTYPQELEIVIKNGVASSNVNEPYFIPNDVDQGPSKPKNLVAIDTHKNDVSLSEIDTYDSFLILTKKNLIFNQQNEQTRIIPLDAVKDFTINKQKTQSIADKLLKWLPLFVVILAFLGWTIMTIFSFVTSILTVLLLALVPYLISVIRHRKVTYIQAYKMGLFMLGPVIVIGTIAELIGFTSISFWVTLGIILVLSILVIKEREKEPIV